MADVLSVQSSDWFPEDISSVITINLTCSPSMDEPHLHDSRTIKPSADKVAFSSAGGEGSPMVTVSAEII